MYDPFLASSIPPGTWKTILHRVQVHSDKVKGGGIESTSMCTGASSISMGTVGRGVGESSLDLLDSPFLARKLSKAVFLLPVCNVGKRGFLGDGPGVSVLVGVATDEEEGMGVVGESERDLLGGSVDDNVLAPKNVSIPL